MPTWGKIETELGRVTAEELEKDLAPIREAVRTAVGPLILAYKLDGEQTHWRRATLAWLRLKMMQKMKDPAFLSRVYGKELPATLGENETKAMINGCALAVTEALLDEILKVK